MYYRRDSRGTVIEPGQRVAYNLSGQVGEGVVQAVRGGTTSIELLDRCAGMPPGHISKVKNSCSILVLKITPTTTYDPDRP